MTTWMPNCIQLTTKITLFIQDPNKSFTRRKKIIFMYLTYLSTQRQNINRNWVYTIRYIVVGKVYKKIKEYLHRTFFIFTLKEISMLVQLVGFLYVIIIYSYFIHSYLIALACIINHKTILFLCTYLHRYW